MALGLIIQRRSYFPPGGWPECSGTGGRNQSECPAGMDRNRWPECVGIRTQILVGKLQKIKSISIWPGDGKEEIEERIEKEIAEVDEGDGVIILTDMLGGTPTNLILSYLKGKHAEVITGVNMPMLLLLSSHRAEKSLERIAALVKKAGRRSITLPQRFLGWRRRRIGSDILSKLQDGDHKLQKCRESFAGDQKENLAMPV